MPLSRPSRRGAALQRALLALFLLALSSTSLAQASRTWVSGVGDDANPCSRTAPCKTFAGAISKTAAGGEIDALDAGGFGAVTITKSITINGYELGSILSAGTHAIIVNAAPTDVVRIRNLSINGVGSGLDGIRFLSGAALHVDNVHVQSVSGFGVNFVPTSSAKLYISNSSFIDGTTLVGGGVHVASSGTGQATVDNVRFANNTGAGLKVSGATNSAHIHGNAFAGNRFGMQAVSGGRIFTTLGNRFSNNLVEGFPSGMGIMR